MDGCEQASLFASELASSNGVPRLTGQEQIEGSAIGDRFVCVDIIPYSVTHQHWYMRFIDKAEAWMTKRPVNETGVYAMIVMTSKSHCPGKWNWTYEPHAGCDSNPWPDSPRIKPEGFIYFIYAEDLRRIKIGYSVFPSSRIEHLQTGSPCVLKLLGSIPGTQNDERKLHSRFKQTRVTGEWFDVNPAMREYLQGVIGDDGVSSVKCLSRD